MTPHLNRLLKTVQMRGHNIYFDAELTKIIPDYHLILPLNQSSGVQRKHCVIKRQLDIEIKFSFGINSSIVKSAEKHNRNILRKKDRIAL